MTDQFEWRSPTVWAVPALALAILALLLVSGANREAFAALNGWSRATGAAPWPYLTVLGDTAVALALFLPFALRRPDILWAMAVSALLAVLVVHSLKPGIDSARPPAVLAAEAITVIGHAYRTHSFPSGHTTTIFVAAGLLWLHFDSSRLRFAALAVAILVGLSRSVVGVHWPVDVAAGAAIGWLAACCGTSVARRWRFGEQGIVQLILIAICAGCAVALLAGLNTGYPQAAPLQYAVGVLALAGLCLGAKKKFAG